MHYGSCLLSKVIILCTQGTSEFCAHVVIVESMGKNLKYATNTSNEQTSRVHDVVITIVHMGHRSSV